MFIYQITRRIGNFQPTGHRIQLLNCLIRKATEDPRSTDKTPTPHTRETPIHGPNENDNKFEIDSLMSHAVSRRDYGSYKNCDLSVDHNL